MGNQKWPYVGDVTFQHTRQKHALSLEHSHVHVAWSGVIGKMLAGPRTQKIMSAQGAIMKGTTRQCTIPKTSNREEQWWTLLVGSRSRTGFMTRHSGVGGR